MKGSIHTAFQYVAYLGYRGIAGIGSRLSIAGCHALGSPIGKLGWHVAVPYRRLVRRNLRLAFEGEKTEEEIRDLGRQHFQQLITNIFLSSKFASMEPSEIEGSVVRYEGLEHIEAAAKAGKGVIAAISHLGPWELFAQLPSLGHGVAKSTMYRALTNPYINRHIVAQRERIGVKLFDRSTGVFGPLKHLRQGGGIGILIDQHTGDHGIWCPLFGRLAATTNLPALLSLRTGAAVVSCAILPDGENRWKVVYRAPHFPNPSSSPSPSSPAAKRADLATRAADLTVALNRELEASIREAPQEWFWVHNRWKTPSPRFLIASSDQQIIVPGDGSDEAPKEEDNTASSSSTLKPFRLLLRSPNPLGDACMAVPAVRAIKRGRPDLQLTMLCRENLAPIWRACPEIDELVVVSRKDSARTVGRQIRGQAQFDAALLFPNSLSSAAETWFARIPRTFGYRGHWRRHLLDRVIDPLPIGPPQHHAHSYLHLAEAVGAEIGEETREVETIDSSSPLSSPLSSSTPMERDGDSSRPFHLGVCPGAEYGAAKRWPEAQFAHVVNVVRKSKDCDVSLFGSPNEAPIGESLAALIDGPCDNQVGKTSLEGLLDHLRSCDALLTNDTGTMHLAAMLGIPTIAIFGSTEPLWTRPLGRGHHVIRKHVACSPCFLRECPIDFRCMTEIDPQKAVDAVLQVAAGKTGNWDDAS